MSRINIGLRIIVLATVLSACAAERIVYRDVRYITIEEVGPYCAEDAIISISIETPEREESKLWWLVKFSGSLLLEFLGAEKLWD